MERVEEARDDKVEAEVRDDEVETELWDIWDEAGIRDGDETETRDDDEVDMEVWDDEVEADVWEDEVGVVDIWDNGVKMEVQGSDELETEAPVVDKLETVWGERGEILKEWWNCSPNESSAFREAFTPISLEVNKGGIFCGMPLTIINASAIQKDVVCLRIR